MRTSAGTYLAGMSHYDNIFTRWTWRSKSPTSFTGHFFIYYGNYRLLLTALKRFAPLAEVNLASDPRFIEWQASDDALTSRLHDVLAKPEMATKGNAGGETVDRKTVTQGLLALRLDQDSADPTNAVREPGQSRVTLSRPLA